MLIHVLPFQIKFAVTVKYIYTRKPFKIDFPGDGALGKEISIILNLFLHEDRPMLNCARCVVKHYRVI